MGPAASAASAASAAPAGGAAPPKPWFVGGPRSARNRSGFPAQVISDELKSKLTASFATVTRKRLRPGAAGRPGKPIDTGKAVTAGNPEALRAAGRPAPPGVRPSGSRRDAQLVLSRIDPWSVMKFSFLVSLVGWVILFVAVAVLYYFLSSVGVFRQIEQTVGLVTSSQGSPGSNAASWFAASNVLGYTMLAGAIDVVVITVIATIGAVIYNAVTHLTGGIEITLKESE